MRPATRGVWLPFFFFFSLALSGIGIGTLVITGSHDAWLPTVVCFLPVAFLFAAVSDFNTRVQVRALSARIGKIEGETMAPVEG